MSKERIAAFFARYNAIRDPYAHEFAVHMVQRAYHHDRALEPERDHTAHYTIAFFENDILLAYFPNAINASRLLWDNAITARMAAGARRDKFYLSKASSNLITRLDENEVLILFAVGISLSLAGGAWLSRRGRSV